MLLLRLKGFVGVCRGLVCLPHGRFPDLLIESSLSRRHNVTVLRQYGIPCFVWIKDHASFVVQPAGNSTCFCRPVGTKAKIRFFTDDG